MSALPLLPLGLQAGGAALRGLFPNQFGGNSQFYGQDPSQFKNDIVFNDGDISQLRDQITNIATTKAGNVNVNNLAKIRSAGASNRLPKGAILSALAGSSQQVAKGVGESTAKAVPALAQMKQNSLLQYLNLQNQFDQRKTQFEAGQNANNAAFYQDTFGGMSKIATLWAGGYFDKPGGKQ